MKLFLYRSSLVFILVSAIVLYTAAITLAVQPGNEPVGKVVAVRGNVTASSDTDTLVRPLSFKSHVFLKETIKTGNGRVQIIFKDSTIVTLGRGSEMLITKFIWNPQDNNGAMETKISEGSFRIMGGSIARTVPDNFKTQTPSAVIGIRGSMYAGMVKGASLSVIFQGGRGIYVKNDFGMVSITRPGFGTSIRAAGVPPEKPQKVDAAQLQKLENSLTVQKSEEPDSSGESAPAPAMDGENTPVADTRTPDTVSGLASIVSNAISVQTEKNLISNLSSGTIESKILSRLIELGYTGESSLSTSVPDSGIWGYTGILENEMDYEEDGKINFIVNWHNKRIMAVEGGHHDEGYDPNQPNDGQHDHGIGFGFASIDTDGRIYNLTVLGSDALYDTGSVFALTGSETFGHFYGSGQSGLGLAMEGYDINLVDSSDKEFWKDIGAAVKSETGTHSTGTEIWTGFFIGIAEDMTNPNVDRRIFTNTAANTFAITIDKDAGTLSGLMSGTDYYDDASNFITNIVIGGDETQSAYITDWMLAAVLSGSTPVEIDSNPVDLKTYGNFMVTAGEETFSNYTSWGFWEAAYVDPVSGHDYHIHVPGSMWLAGKQTPASDVTARISADFSGHYRGRAEGIRIDTSSQVSQLTNGETRLDINFAADAVTPVSGNIIFDQITLDVTSANGNLGPDGFTATILDTSKSMMNGTFYGDQVSGTLDASDAMGVGGNFSATMNDNNQYHGIFAGDRQ